MSRRLVPIRVLLGPIDLDQQKSRRILDLLQKVEPHHSRLPPRSRRVVPRRGDELLHELRPNVDMNVYDQHSTFAN